MIGAICLTCFGPQRAYAQAAGLVAAYSFDEGAGTTVADRSGNGNTGRIVGALWTTVGKYGKALSFNGAGSYVDLGNPASLRLTGSMTWSAWINAAASPADDGEIIAKSDNGPGWQIKTSPDTGPHKFGVAVSASSGLHTQRYSTTVRALNTWYHVAGVYNASARTLDVYVNGVLDDGVLVGAVPAAQVNSSVNVNIGRRTGGYYFNGVIDEVRIYSRALTQSEIQADMNTPIGVAATDTQSPTAPGTLTATAASANEINLSWAASTDNVAVTGYLVERCQGVACATFSQIAAPGTATIYNDTAVTAGTTYSYRVRATDAAGNLSGYSPIANTTTPAAADTQAPTAPSTLAATAASAGQINLSWAASTDNVGVTGYRVERCQGPGCATFAQTAATVGSGTTYSDTGLSASTTYSYRARAVDAANNFSGYSPVASATTPAASDTQPPNAPGALTATAASASQIDLSWGASTDNVGVTEYRVERCQGAGCANFTQVSASTTGISGPLTASATNPRYFLDASGRAVALSGSHTWNNLQDWGTNGTIQTLDFTAYVNSLVSHGHNFTLLWLTELTKFCGLPTTANAPPDFTVTPHPWQRSGPGTASDGGPKFDLSKFDQSFFDRLRSRVQQLNTSGIYAGVYLFSGEWLSSFRCSGDGYPLSLSNNINGIDDGGGTGSLSMAAPNAITDIQDAFVNKMVDTLNDLPNVLWIVSEEAPGNSTWWNEHNISHLRAYENGKPQHHPIGWAVLSDANDATIYNSDADWVAPAARLSPTLSCGTGTPACKVNINDSDHSYFGMWNDSAQANRQYAWANFLAGNQVIFMDPYDVYYPRENRNLCISQLNGICSGPDPRWNNFRDNLGYIVTYSRKLSLSQVTPQPSLSSTGYCLAQTPATGAEYLVYAPSGGSFTVNLSATTRLLNVEWLDPSTGTITSGGTTTGGSSSRSFTPPFGGDAILYLVDAAGHAGTASGTRTTYSDTPLTANASYSYRVRAADAAGNLSPYSNVATATTLGTDSQAPTAPGTVTATAASVAEIDLSWAASLDNVGVAGYRVERCQGAGCATFVQIAAPAGTGTTYSDSGLTANTSYIYRVRATDAAGNLSAYSNAASATTLTTISGLVAAYSFNEGTGTSVADASGNGNTGTVVGASWTAGGKYGGALSFNGSSSYVDLGNPAAFGVTGSMTWSAWINSAANPPDDGIIVAKSDSASGWQVKTSPDTGPQTFGSSVSASAGSRIQRYSTTVRSLNTWYHVAGVYDASARTLSVYVNGVLSNGALVGTVPASQVRSSVNVNIGRRTGGLYFNGIIDEVRIYNRALTQSEIQADMNTPVGNGGSNPPPPAVMLSSSSLAFGNQATGTASGPKSISLTNTGGSLLAIGSIAVSGANSSDFAQSGNCGASLAPNGSCTITIVFTPASTGARSAAVTIADNAPGSPHTAGLTGTGTASAGLSVSPHVSALTFTRTQQFNASNNNGVVSWLVDGQVGGSAASGTISITGLYSPPGSIGTYTVTALDQSASANATVYVTNYPGTFTRDVDTLRTGLNSNETVLTPANVNSAQFGRLFSYTLDGVADASPLYMANVSIPGQGFHNVVYVATEHDSVYAFDADGLSGNPLWEVSFINPAGGVTTVPPGDTGECCDISPEIGITGSPVINPATGTLYVVAKTKEVSGGTTTYAHRLHALDITTGAEKFGGPVIILASVPGTGAGASGGQTPFIALRENQRPALLLSNGVVYFAFAAHGDQPPYHGWVLGYNAATLQQVMAYNSTPNGSGGGIWQSGDGLAADSTGNIYFVTGNGDFDANSGGSSYGDSFVKLSPGGVVPDYFTPHDQANMQANDLDLGSGGTLLLPDQSGPHPHLAISAGKNGTIYLVDRDNMGRYIASNDSQIVQSLVNVFPNGTFMTGNFKAPLYFNGSVYFSADADTIKSFKVANGLLSTAPTSQTSLIPSYPGATLSISANGNSNGILWAVQRIDFGPTGGGGPRSPGVLHAYDATNLATELYTSNQAAGSRDALDFAAKWSAALVANGKVFVATNALLTVFSLLP